MFLLRDKARESRALSYGQSRSVQRLLLPLGPDYDSTDRAMDLLTILLALLPRLVGLDLTNIGEATEPTLSRGFRSFQHMMRRVVMQHDKGNEDAPLQHLHYLNAQDLQIERLPSLLVMPNLKLACFKSCGTVEPPREPTAWPTYDDGNPMMSPMRALVIHGIEWYGVEYCQYIMDRVKGPAVFIHNPDRYSSMWEEGEYSMNLNYTSATKISHNNTPFLYVDYWHPLQTPPEGGFQMRHKYGGEITFDQSAMEQTFHTLAAPWFSDPLPDIRKHIIQHRRGLGLDRLRLNAAKFGGMIEALNEMTDGNDYEMEQASEADDVQPQDQVKRPLTPCPIP